jgi:enamine deaminase RidA (YjgF/YER057c/UK114 family)
MDMDLIFASESVATGLGSVPEHTFIAGQIGIDPHHNRATGRSDHTAGQIHVPHVVTEELQTQVELAGNPLYVTYYVSVISVTREVDDSVTFANFELIPGDQIGIYNRDVGNCRKAPDLARDHSGRIELIDPPVVGLASLKRGGRECDTCHR